MPRLLPAAGLALPRGYVAIEEASAELFCRRVAGRSYFMSVDFAPSGQFPWTEADAMFLLLIKRAAELGGHGRAYDEEELDCLRNAIGAYEAKRFPSVLSPYLPATD